MPLAEPGPETWTRPAVVAAGLGDKGVAARRIALARGMEDPGDLTPPFERHGEVRVE